MDFLGDANGWLSLTKECYSGRFFLSLSKDKVSSLREGALEKKMRFKFLFGLSNQFENLVLLLLIKVGLEGSSLSQIAQGHAPLPLIDKPQLDYC